MTDFLYSLDRAVFYWINHGWSNPFFDWLMPFLTERKNWFPVWVILFGWLIWKGGQKGRLVVAMAVLIILITDQVSSGLIKPWVDRVRPSNALPDVHLLVKRTFSNSFPSSHAANFFAGAVLLSWFYRKWLAICFGLAVLVSLSRPYVGVHYPSDILGGAVLGSGTALMVIYLTRFIAGKTGISWLQVFPEGDKK